MTNARFLPGNIFDNSPGVLVVPANSKGDLDQGLGLQCALRFCTNKGVENRLKAIVTWDHEGALQPGEVQCVPAYDTDFSKVIFLSIVDEDMRVPNCGIVTKAVASMFHYIAECNAVGGDFFLNERLLVSGLGAGIMGLTPEESAKAFCKGYQMGVKRPPSRLYGIDS